MSEGQWAFRPAALKADIAERDRDVCFVPKADISRECDQVCWCVSTQ